MKVSRNVILSLEILAAHKARTCLSVLGIIVGVASVILMVSAGRGAEKRILDRIRSMGTDVIVVSAGQTRIVAGRKRQMDVVTTLVPSDARALAEQCPSVALAAPALIKKLSVRGGAENTNTNVLGMTIEGLAIRNITVASGRGFSPAEGRARRRVALIGPTARENLFGEEDPIGQRIRIGGVVFEVIGLTAPKGTNVNGQDQDDLVIIPLETAMRRVTNVTHVQTVYVRARGPERLEEAEAEIRQLLRQRHRLKGKRDDFTIQNQAALLAAERETARAMTALTGSVAGISLVVGGVGILAVMLISVRERAREIGLRRAVGALRRDIKIQFLLESSLLGGAGGAVGVAVGTGCALALSRLGYWQTIISWPAVCLALAFSVVVGMISGIYPAVHAARLEPVEALRSE